MKITQFIFSFLLVMFLCGFGCSSSKPTPDPLAGFHIDALHALDSNKAITDDSQDYIKKLSLKNGDFVGAVEFLEDGTGQHAVDIAVGASGRWWRHILIYDKADKRIKVIVYKTGGYQS